MKRFTITGNVLELTLKVKAENVGRGNASISEEQKNQVQHADMVQIKVIDFKGNLLGAWVGWGHEFHATLRKVDSYYLLRYKKAK